MAENLGRFYKEEGIDFNKYACEVLQTTLLTEYTYILRDGGIKVNEELEKQYIKLGFTPVGADNHHWVNVPTEENPKGEYFYQYGIFVNHTEELVLQQSTYGKITSISIYSKGANRDFFNKLKIILQKLEPEIDEDCACVYFLYRTKSGMQTREVEIKLPEINQVLYYNNLPHEEIVESLNARGSGIIYFSGEPGTGKTTYIKYLSTLSDRKFFYLTTNVFSELSDPSHTGFVMDCLKDSVLIIEDAEILLASRETHHNSDVSNILNWSDGMLGDVLNCKIILTQNYESDTDEAVFRKGRLLVRHNFDLLEPEQANKIAGFDKFTEPTSLADALFTKEDEEVETKKETKIGF